MLTEYEKNNLVKSFENLSSQLSDEEILILENGNEIMKQIFDKGITFLSLFKNNDNTILKIDDMKSLSYVDLTTGESFSKDN